MEKSITATWLSYLRWFAFIGQVFVLCLAVGYFNLTLPWIKITSLLLLIPLSNILLFLPRLMTIDEKLLIGGFLIFDTILLTAILSLAGGATNPFTIFYLLQVVLAALMLNASWTWAVAATSSICFASLFIFSMPVPEWDHHGAHHGFSLHLHGMLIAYVTASLLAAYFLNKIASDLKSRERKIERLENIALNMQKLASLTTVTAGAAHELGTPLGTIALVSHELENYFKSNGADNNLLEDIALLKSETARCKSVLQELSEKTGDLLGETPQSFSASDLLSDAIEVLNAGKQVNTLVLNDKDLICAPRKALTMALRALVKNALDASSPDKGINIKTYTESGQVIIEVSDQGCGMDRQTLERVGEPFFSTKGNGKGMGLGVYLTKLTLEQIGGKLSYDSQSGDGTRAIVTFPSNSANFGMAA